MLEADEEKFAALSIRKLAMSASLVVDSGAERCPTSRMFEPPKLAIREPQRVPSIKTAS